ncbi:MAG: hypothetical protein Q4D39_04245 [Coriobacteriaceae bacterium]|nr:hypothetical protein [Coriobacteriaceae bacterium]
MGKRDHLKDYVPTEDGGYEYVGTHWSWPSAEIRAGFLSRARMLYGVAVACIVAAGCIPAPGTFGAFYVVLPFLIGAVGIVLAGVALFRIYREDDPMRDHIYASSVPTFSPKLLVGAAGSVVCAAAALIHGIVLAATASPDAALPFSLLFASLMFGSAVCLWQIHSAFSGIIFTREKS